MEAWVACEQPVRVDEVQRLGQLSLAVLCRVRAPAGAQEHGVRVPEIRYAGRRERILPRGQCGPVLGAKRLPALSYGKSRAGETVRRVEPIRGIPELLPKYEIAR